MGQQRQPGAIVLGLGLMVAGGWLIATVLGAPLMPFSRLWPLGISFAGLVLLARRSLHNREDIGLLLFGSILLPIGLFLSLFTFQIGNLTWLDMARYWPILSLIVGFAFALVYLAGDLREQALLLPIYILGGSGLIALPFTLRVVGSIVSGQSLWLSPLLLALIALAVLIKVRGRDGPQAEG